MENVLSILNEGAGSILGFIVALVPAIILHEMGHMFAAKWLGVWVREFGIGFPPRITKLFRWQETIFTLNWLPFGGFARMEGETFTELQGGEEEIEEPSPEELREREEARKHSLNSLAPLKRIPIFVAGPVMNFLLAVLLAVTLYMTGYPVIDRVQVGIADVAPGSPAAEAGIQAGDMLVEVEGQPIAELNDVTTVVDEHLGEPVSLTVRRGEALETLSLVPRENPPPGEGAMGVVISQEPEYHIETLGLPGALVQGLRLIFNIIGQTLMAPIRVIQGLIPLEMARPVGIINTSRLAYATIQESIEMGTLLPILQLLIVVNVSLSIFNLLPLPVLDGGHVLIVIIEAIRNRPLSMELKERAFQAAALLFIVLFIAMVVLDLLFPIV